MTTTQRFTPADAGTWFDSSNGIYIGEMVIELAESLGYVADEENRHADDEFYHEEWDSAEDFLNDHYAPENYYFHSSEWGSDWGLWHACEDDPANEVTADVWQERDRLHLAVYQGENAVLSLWDEKAARFLEEEDLVRRNHILGRLHPDWMERDLIIYARERGLVRDCVICE